jgi:hypothetical protein
MRNIRKGRPTTLTVSVVDTEKNAVIYTGSVSRFISDHFKYCNERTVNAAKAMMYNSMNTGCKAFGGKIRVLKNLEF